MEVNHTLEHLNLSNNSSNTIESNDIKNKGAIYISTAIRKNCFIKTLNLGRSIV